MITKCNLGNPLYIRRKLSLHKMFRRRPGRLLSVLDTFDVRPALKVNATDNLETEVEDVRSSIIVMPTFDKDADSYVDRVGN